MAAIGFIDLLASKSSALLGDDNFHRAMEEFHRAILANADELGNEKKIRAFADCLYFQSNSPASCIRFVQSIRNNLFSKGYFFKGAIGTGRLGEQNVLTAFAESAPENTNGIEGVTFGGDVVSVYLASESFKGIGCFIHRSFGEALANELGKDQAGSLVIQSVFFPDERSTVVRKYFDVAFSSDELENEDILFRRTMTYFEEAKIQKKKYSRFYFPLMMMHINASSLSVDDIAPHKNGTEQQRGMEVTRTKFIYKYFLSGGAYSSRFSDIPCFEFPYLKIIDRLMTLGADEPRIRALIRAIPGRKRVLSDLDDLPPEILSVRNKRSLGKVLAQLN